MRTDNSSALMDCSASWEASVVVGDDQPLGQRACAAADLNGDGIVSGLDLAMLLGAWTGAATYGPCPATLPADLNGDSHVNGLDLALLLGAWG
jgi:hypothetical protein